MLATDSIINHYKNLKADYDAARPSNNRRRRYGLGGTADAHLGYSWVDLWVLREYCRDVVRNDGIIGQALDRATGYIVSGTLVPEMKTGDKGLNDDIRDDFAEWSNDPRQCDARKKFNFREMTEFVNTSSWIDGDIFGNPLESGAIELVEADRCLTPNNTLRNVVHGVLLDDLGAPREYWFTAAPKGEERLQHIQRVMDMDKYPAWTSDRRPEFNNHPAIFHVYSQSASNRYSSTRGVPLFVQCLDKVGLLGDLEFATLIKSQVAACIAMFIEVENETISRLGEGEPKKIEARQFARAAELKPGMIELLRKGEKASGFSPNVPNDSHFEHVKLCLRQIGANIGLPLSLMLLSTAETNFHGYRGEINEARRGFKRRQKFLHDKWFAPVLTWRILRRIDEGSLKGATVQKLLKSLKIFKHLWTPAQWPYVDPLKDAQADDFQVAHFLESRRNVSASRGREFGDILRENLDDNTRMIFGAIKRSKKINDAAKSIGVEVDITWRDVLDPLNKVSIKDQATPKDLGEDDDETGSGAPLKTKSKREAA